MNRKKKVRRFHSRTYAISVGTIIILFIVAGYFFTNIIRSFLVNRMGEESSRLANNYMSRLSEAATASKIINELLDGRLMVVNNAIWRNQDKISSDLLKEFTKELEVDEIYLYNSEGEIIYSTTDEYIGWKARKGHPVYEFMKSGDLTLVEDIRKDTESEQYYKYGYTKIGNGQFIQVGILADKVNDLTSRFSTRHFINTLTGEDNIKYIYFIDNNLHIAASNEKTKIGPLTLNNLEKLAIIENRSYSCKKQYKGKSVYQTLSPIYVDDVKMGTLAVIYSLEDTDVLIKQISFIALGVLFFLFAAHGILAVIIIKKTNEIEKLAYYDSLTNLPNDEHFVEFFNEELIQSKEKKKALLLLNYSNLGLVKLIFGYEGLHNIIQQITKKLKSLDVNKNHLFRHSEDSFLIYIDDYKEKEQLVNICDTITKLFLTSIQTGSGSKFIDLRIGVVEIDESYTNANNVIKDAEIAASNVNEKGNKEYCFFDETMAENLMFDEIMEKELRKAIYDQNSQELYLEYQPQIDLKTNKIIGFEALARWENKELGRISPIKFINIAERRQLIIPLGERVLTTACDFIKTLEKKGYQDIKVAVNISLIQLLQDDFVESVMKIIEDTKIKPGSLELEITETILADNYEIINEKLSVLKNKGVNISLDDFGTGYSSLARLRNLNINMIKIDKFFIDSLIDKDPNEVLTGAIISLAHRLGLRVIAEGVEFEEQKEYLIANQCDIMQGYLFSKPVPEDEVIEILNQTNISNC